MMHDTDIALKVSKRQISVYPLSSFFIGSPNRNGLVFGYAGVEVRDIKSGVETLAKAIRRN
jgi:DNA-binding transcriptional MocR family regulator